MWGIIGFYNEATYATLQYTLTFCMSKALPIRTKDLSTLAAAINVSNELNGRMPPELPLLATVPASPDAATALPRPVKPAAATTSVKSIKAPKVAAPTPRKSVSHQEWKQTLAASQLPRLNTTLLATRQLSNTMRQSVKARITALAQLLDCSPSLLVQYLSTLYMRPFTPTTLLHKEELAAVLSRYGQPDRLRNVEIVDAINAPSAKRTDASNVVLLFENNLFEQVQQTVLYNRMRVQSHFTDEQAVVICSKMADSYARTLAVNYRRLSDTDSIQVSIYRYQLHFLAEKARHRYGGAILTFLYQLRSLKFSDRQANTLQTDKNLAGIEADFPALTFASRLGEEYTLVFHLVPGLPVKNPAARVSVLSHRASGGAVLGAIDHSGYALDLQGQLVNKLKQASSSLLIFCNYMQDKRQLEFFSGVESGKCFVCSRPLTEPRSVRYGIGPVCLLRLGGL